ELGVVGGSRAGVLTDVQIRGWKVEYDVDHSRPRCCAHPSSAAVSGDAARSVARNFLSARKPEKEQLNLLAMVSAPRGCSQTKGAEQPQQCAGWSHGRFARLTSYRRPRRRNLVRGHA